MLAMAHLALRVNLLPIGSLLDLCGNGISDERREEGPNLWASWVGTNSFVCLLRSAAFS